MTGRATVYDVAERAGVSIKTVSRVVNGSDAVTPATRERVLAAVDALKYVPNSHALSLRSGSTRTVGVVVDALNDPFFAAIVAVVERQLAAEGYTVLVAATNRIDSREREQVLALAGHRIAGLVLSPTTGDHDYLQDAIPGIPLVLVDRADPAMACDVVKVDDLGATRSAIGELIDLGHRRIAFVGDDLSLTTVRDRHLGYQQAYADRGLKAPTELARWGSNTPQQAMTVVSELLAADDAPTAFFCCHPRGAAGVVRALHLADRTDCAIVSFGDVELGDVIRPGLTVIDHRPESVAEATADLLLQRLAEAERSDPRSAPVERLVPLSMIRRGSGELIP